MDNDNTKYYKALGIEATANREEIAAAYRQLALESHPLRNDPSKQAQCYLKFTRLCEAYEVLSDPLMKRVYDKYGEFMLKNGVSKGTDKFPGYVNKGNHFKVFERFFGSSNPFIESPARREGELTELEQIDKKHRAEDIVVTLECTLYELFNGTIKEVTYARKQMLSTTSGYVINENRFQIEVLPGFSEETKLVYKGLGHESFGAKPSDLIVKFKQLPMVGMQRSGDDLIYTHTVSLVDALQMQPIIVQTLDNRQVQVAANEVVSPQTELRVACEGMPRARSGDVVVDTTTQLLPAADQPKGDLIVKFNIVFPKRILNPNRQAIIEALRAN